MDAPRGRPEASGDGRSKILSSFCNYFALLTAFTAESLS